MQTSSINSRALLAVAFGLMPFGCYSTPDDDVAAGSSGGGAEPSSTSGVGWTASGGGSGLEGGAEVSTSSGTEGGGTRGSGGDTSADPDDSGDEATSGPTDEPTTTGREGDPLARSGVAFHRPGEGWSTVPVLRPEGDGTWTDFDAGAPAWANQPGTIAIGGDYDGDLLADVAFHRPGSTWTSVPVLLANGDGTWTPANTTAPGWANQADVVAVAGDYDGDSRTDIAFHRPGGTWNTVPVILANGDGTWSDHNTTAPLWANQPGVIAVAGDYDGDALTDVAFHRPGSTWTSVPVLLANGDGTWNDTNMGVPPWANQPDVVAIPGDYNGDSRTDIAFYRPNGPWSTVPVLFANGDGSWSTSDSVVPGWPNQPDVVAIPGDFDGDGLADIAFHRPGGPWGTVPVLFSDGDGSWTPADTEAPGWANQPGVVAIPGRYDDDGRTDIAFHRPGSSWTSMPVLLANGDGTWSPANTGVPDWVNQEGVVAIPLAGR